MSRRFAFGLLWVLLTLVVAGGAAAYAYHLGTLATVSAAAGGGYVVHPYGGYWGWGPGFGFGFFPFGFLFPLFFILLLFWLLRPRRWHGGPGGPWHHDEHRRHHFEEWHRQAHGEAPPPEPRSEQPPRP